AASVQCFNLAGRIEFTGEYSPNQSVSGISLCQGIYILRISRGTLTEVLKVTVL
ncbi:MAG: T9SS type A sorting domain-containing protein, partial [Candidatus Sabulitectum sp.]|nr:T9SS type A sorting domain-containing protein [Candidatus Sabulitectum sp.]